jgi:hypothetical protein
LGLAMRNFYQFPSGRINQKIKINGQHSGRNRGFVKKIEKAEKIFFHNANRKILEKLLVKNFSWPQK